ncbi:uncharacterized protein LOC106761996 [Vigna radiata var. radiata]|uniref:Uncharacterized protein LOC106761996 n=1 Tax=Vigna radiata var. radiata TaxID=3916 RepID=A0A1S3U555_VIGRR|nr:uncharacterized protein LOC106761996 [Vigna radiata var. radiata]
MSSIGFEKCVSEHGVYVQCYKEDEREDRLIVCLYVDDLLITGSSSEKISFFKGQMLHEFEMSDLGQLSYFLGIEFTKTVAGMLMHQSRYALDMLTRFNMLQCNSATTPAEVGLKLEKDPEEEAVDPTEYRRMVGSLRYLCNTRPDISYSVGLVSRFMQNESGGEAMECYCLRMNQEERLTWLLIHIRIGVVTRVIERVQLDICFFLEGAPISWSSTKEPIVALSSCEAEYIAACEATCQAAWLDSLMKELRINVTEKVRLLVDNKSAIDLTKHPTSHGRSKHIETRFHFIREQVGKGKIEVVYCKSEDQTADILTKALKRERFLTLRKQIGVIKMEIGADLEKGVTKT